LHSAAYTVTTLRGGKKKQAFTLQKIEGFSLFAPKRAHPCGSNASIVQVKEKGSGPWKRAPTVYVLENVAPPSLEWSF